MSKILTILLLPLITYATDKNDCVGLFWSPDKDGKIQVYEKEGKYYGKLVWSERPEELDTENPDEKLRSRKKVGLDLFYDFVFDPDDDEWNGMIYDPQSGNTYKCNMWLIEDGKILKVRGYIGFSWIGRTEEFERIE